ncbi:MAG: M23 family metallopeptidase [Aphanocapsa lilacina HA4352-LM1]|nr:M23 family metallopeptidase [Aphanocapsa lilacina HA4352-LM1]
MPPRLPGVLLCAVLIALGVPWAASASQEATDSALSLIDPASPQVLPEAVPVPTAPLRLKITRPAPRRLPKPPRVGARPAQSALPPAVAAPMLDSLVPVEAPEATAEALVLPLSLAAPVIAPFGERVHLLTGAVTFHRGVDLAAAQGTPVVAAAAGLVLAAGAMGPLGNAVVLGHSQGGRSRYGHLQEVAVRPGEWVQKGALIGRVGSSGLVTAPCLHFEYWRKSATATWQAIDPATLLSL